MVERLKTSHAIKIGDAVCMSDIEDRSIDLVLTSPPYPMIQMWDDLFCEFDPTISESLLESNGSEAFERMHIQLDAVWKEVFRVLKPGGIACINVGDATRNLNGHFQLFPNHARVLTKFLSLGFSQLPAILWRKPTNAPNKFMGSGMLPPGAYVTLEHEYILIFRNGPKRHFNKDQNNIRQESAYFWEERNVWFSDIWLDLYGTSQKLNNPTKPKRSGAFPLELAFRLINMFSIYGDMIVDPFLGSGTTMIAAMCAARNSIGYEINEDLHATILEKIASIPEVSNRIIQDRLKAHGDFVRDRMRKKNDLKHTNKTYGFPVMTRQEATLRFHRVHHLQYQSNTNFILEYGYRHSNELVKGVLPATDKPPQNQHLPHKERQMKLF